MKILRRFSLLFLLSPMAANASLDHMFSKLGASSNYTDPSSFRDQAVGHYTLGSLAVRQRNKSIQPFNLRLPSGIGQGSCGNMDLRFGGFSFIDAQEFLSMLRRVGQGLPTYGFQLAMKTWAPQIEGLMSELRGYLQEINNMTLDDCRMRQAIFDGVLPKQGAMRETLCQDISTTSGEGDFFGAMSQCRGEEAQHAHQRDDKYEHLLTGEYNLVWKVIQEMPKYKDNRDVAEFVMSVVGTVISRRNPDTSSKKAELKASTYELHTTSPRADEMDFVAAHLEGGSTSKLTCDETGKCLHPIVEKIRIPADQAMTDRVIRVVNGLQSKYLTGGKLSKEEQGVLGDAYAVPIFKYIQVSAAANTNVILVKDAARFIAISLIMAQFDSIAAEITMAVETLESIQVDQSAIKQFKKNLQHARTRIQAQMKKSDYEGIWRLNQHIKSLENVIEASTDS